MLFRWINKQNGILAKFENVTTICNYFCCHRYTYSDGINTGTDAVWASVSVCVCLFM